MINSPLNYPGNKYKVLKQIIPLLRTKEKVICDVFCGSGLVSINSEYYNITLNDSSSEVIELIELFKNEDPNNIIQNVDKLIKKYKFTDTYRNSKSIYPEIRHEGLSKFNKTPFENLKRDYNKKKNPIKLFTLTIFSFNHYIRFNKRGQYNLPVGKVDFSKSLRDKTIAFSNALKKKNTSISHKDFRDKTLYTKDALYYFDPPYLITNAPYNNKWGIQDEIDLLKILDNLNASGKKFALSNVLKSNGKENDLLIKWSKNYNVHKINRKYLNSNYRKKNITEAEEVLITNYKQDGNRR